MSADELSIKLTAKDEASAKLKTAKKAVTDLRKAVADAAKDAQKTGDYAEYDKLVKKLRQATADVTKLGKQQQQLNKDIQALERGPLSAVQKVGNAWVKMTKAFENPIVSAVSIGSMVAFGKASVNAFAEAEKSSMQLTLAMQKFPKLADTTRAEFDALNQSLMNTTGADDDMLASTEATLARFDLTGQQIQSLIPLVNDYAIATGQDAAQAASTIGKALLGNAKALKSMGINFKATGDRTKDLAAIMGVLEEKVGGTGEAFGKTAAGQLAIAHANFQNLQEEIGAALVPELEALVKVIRPIGELFKAMPEPLRTATVTVIGFGVAAMVATPRILAMQKAMAESNVTIGGFVAKRGGMMGAVAALTMLATATRMLANENGNFYQQDNGVISYAEALKTVANPSLGEQVGHVISGITDFFVPHNTYLEDAKAKLAGYDQELAGLVAKGNAGEAKTKFDELVKSAKEQGIAIDDLTALMPAYAAAAREAATDTSGLTQAQRDAIIATENLSGALDNLDTALNRREAKRNYKKSLDDMIKNPSKDSADSAIRSLMTMAKAYDDPKQQAKVAKQGLEQFWDSVNKTGPTAKTKAEYRNLLSELTSIANLAVGGGTVPAPVGKKAAGGAIVGPGTGTSDTAGIYALSNGEYVTRAAATASLGFATMDVLNRADALPQYRLDAIRAAAAGVPASIPSIAITSPSSAGGVDRSIHIGEINAASGVDVQAEILWALHRQDMIARERA